MSNNEIEEIKYWLNIHFDCEDDLIDSLIESAKSELALSGVPDYSSKHKAYPLYVQAIRYIVSRDYETRGFVEYERINKGFNDKVLQSFILKLKAW
ncbi:phage gp6-like head-tail connector protein [Staphylococcus xylosus]|uniref:head-tail connector protein n=1 Tax=Staphylococcus xylosus TaxID=1288 RepID=UPI000E68C1D4|nr:head-tail connector protein [Staphylococcus xylosus]RIM88329.1 phage gp6-like head-tail connector protein [Staphylococcus xylosus]